MSRAPGRLALTFIAVTVLIDAIGFGIVLPVLPKLIITLTGGTLAAAARDAGWLGLAYAAMQFVCGPIVGNLSDRFGRRPVLLASLLAFAADYVLCGFAPSFGWLFLGRVLAGVTGASYTTAYAYVADVSPADKRAQNFGLLGAGFGIGFILGPMIGGFLGGMGVRAPFFVAAALACANVILGYLVLPESLAEGDRRPFHLGQSNPISVLLRLRRGYPSVFGLAIAIFLFQLGGQALPVIWAFFAIERFNWSTQQIGFSLAAVGVVAVIVQGGLIRVITPRLGERRSAVIGLWSTALSWFLFAIAPAGWMVYVAILISGPGDLAYPSINALMSQRISADAQGELQGAVASLTSLATLIAPPVVTQLFAAFSGPHAKIYFPGAPFLFSTLLALATLTLFHLTVRHWAPEPSLANVNQTPRP